MTVLPTELWDRLWERLEALSATLERLGAKAPMPSGIRQEARSVTQTYFRETRLMLLTARVPAELLGSFDARMQDLLRAANAKVPKVRQHLKVLAAAADLRTDIEVSINQALGEDALRRAEGTDYSPTEQKIIDTLNGLVPTAALSYSQALRDLAQADRVSFRGPALELREALREILDHLAPDEAVSAQPGFKLEDTQKKPTMRQKALFILRSRGMAKTALEAPRDAVEIIENSTSSLARSAYSRSALSTHVANTRAEVRQFKMYLDSVLSDLLQLHAPAVASGGSKSKA
jgi:hypothetical protein